MTAWVKRETFTVSANVRFASVATVLPHYRKRRFRSDVRGGMPCPKDGGVVNVAKDRIAP